MTANVFVQPEAEADLAETYRWYEDRRAGLGDEFLDSVKRALDRIADAPRRTRAYHRGSRRYRLDRFPYLILYLTRADKVFVLAVFQERRNPHIFRARVRNFPDDVT